VADVPSGPSLDTTPHPHYANLKEKLQTALPAEAHVAEGQFPEEQLKVGNLSLLRAAHGGRLFLESRDHIQRPYKYLLKIKRVSDDAWYAESVHFIFVFNYHRDTEYFRTKLSR
jgi:hypothetical protein